MFYSSLGKKKTFHIAEKGLLNHIIYQIVTYLMPLGLIARSDQYAEIIFI
jgi:hypothetical protein